MSPATVIIITTLRVAATILAIVFVARYSRDNWRSTPEGRHLMHFSTIVAGFGVLANTNAGIAWLDDTPTPGHLDGDYPGRYLIIGAFYGLVAWSMWERNRLLTRAHQLRRADEEASR